MSDIAKQVSNELIQYLTKAGALMELPAIVEVLQKEAERRQEIFVISAQRIPDKEVQELEKTLVKRFGGHPIIYSIDPSLLTGFIVRFGGVILDLTGRRQLTNLAQALK